MFLNQGCLKQILISLITLYDLLAISVKKTSHGRHHPFCRLGYVVPQLVNVEIDSLISIFKSITTLQGKCVGKRFHKRLRIPNISRIMNT